jgi:hypothetical protein
MLDTAKQRYLEIVGHRELWADYTALSWMIGFTGFPVETRMELYRQRAVVEQQLIEAGAL